jgi:HEAT repeat protein
MVTVSDVIVSDELRRALRDPGYTPPRRAFPEMFALLAHPELAERAERALLSAGLPAATYAAENLACEQSANDAPATESALVRVIGRAARMHEAPQLLEALTRALQSPNAETRRQAAMALGKSGRRAAEPALLSCLDTTDAKLLRSVVEALGKVGGEAALARLRELSAPEALKQVFERARLMLERSALRAEGVAEPIALDRPLPQSLAIALECRAGLATFLAEEAAALAPEIVGPSEVMLRHAGTLRPLLELRLASSVAIAWPLEQGTSADGVLSALLSPALLAAIGAWSNGPLRFRIEWHGAGHRRADTWRIAQGLREAASPLLNDPVQAPWTIEVQEQPPRLLLKPNAAAELRFDYRVRDVPAASHPTLAAALARVAGVRADDVVWDPFVGSGVELVERARLGPRRELHGTDLDARALSAARENTARAGLEGVLLQQADARNHRVPGLTLVLTNPPMGRRVLRARGLSGVLCQVVRNVAHQLAPGGRMVWLSPFPDATARAAADASLNVERLGPIDLGGFSAELQRFTR